MVSFLLQGQMGAVTGYQLKVSHVLSLATGVRKIAKVLLSVLVSMVLCPGIGNGLSWYR